MLTASYGKHLQIDVQCLRTGLSLEDRRGQITCVAFKEKRKGKVFI